MWEISDPYSQTTLRLRRFFMLVATILVTAFAYLLISAPTAGAQATWEGSSIEYQNKTFTRNNNVADNPDLNLPSGAVVYMHINGNMREFIYFNNSSDADTGSSAQYVTYRFTPPDNLSDRSSVQQISIQPRAPDEQTAAENEETTACAVDGIGWIVCPVTNFLATGMDWLFGVLSEMLEVQPLELSSETPLYRAWKMMQAVANLAFIAAFLIIIYSQVTSIGLQNYSIKRLLPRLIIAAILVNVSYYICAVAVDVSNIAGYSLHELFMNMRDNLVGEGGNGMESPKWEDMAAFILSGGTVAAAGTIAAVSAASTYTIGGAIILLLPALLGVVLAVLVALLVLAARQAIITVLIILAPLAFVAYLLPNTEKWFDKWKDTFTTMLLLFPIFSVLFGGAQLAGTAIIQNAGSSINVMILGMITQVAPIVITPFLVKFSGSLIGRIAGMVNNPNRGLIDRTRNFAKDQAEHRKARQTAESMANTPKRRQVLRRNARSMEMRRRKREEEKALWKQQTDEAYEVAKSSSPSLQRMDVELRLAKLNTENFQQEAQRRMDELRAGDGTSLKIQPVAFAVDALQRAKDLDRESRLVTNQIRVATNTQQINFANALRDDERLRDIAGGIGGPVAAQSALASAVSVIDRAEEDAIGEARTLADYFGFNSTMYKQMAMKGSVEVRDESGNITHTFTRDNKFMRKAALREMFVIGTVPEIDEIVEMSGNRDDKKGLYEFRETISNAQAKSGYKEKTVYGAGKVLDDEKIGSIDSREALDASILSYVSKGKFSAEKMAGMDAAAVKRLAKVIEVYKAGKVEVRNSEGKVVGLEVDQARHTLLDNETRDRQQKIEANLGTFLGIDDINKIGAALETIQSTARDTLTDPTIKGRVTTASRPHLKAIQGDYMPPESTDAGRVDEA